MIAYLSISKPNKQMLFKADDLILRFAVGNIGNKLLRIVSYNKGFVVFETDLMTQRADLSELLERLGVRRDLTQYDVEVGINE